MMTEQKTKDTEITEGQNQITEGVIWKQLLLFFFPLCRLRPALLFFVCAIPNTPPDILGTQFFHSRKPDRHFKNPI